MEDNKILKLIRENNPFMSSSSPLPWDNKNPDLPQLNREISEEIEQLMRHKRREPDLPLVGVIFGEAGSGKTHMLTRILRRLRSSGMFAIFVTVRAFRDPETVTQQLLSEIFISLKQIHSNNRTQFDILISQLMDLYNEHRRNDDFPVPDNADMRIYLAHDMPDVDKKFLRGIISYINTSDPLAQFEILDWLSIGLDDEDSMRLGLPSRNLETMTNARREQEAQNTLLSLGRVLAYSKVPMIVCFDQLDGMRDKNLIFAWGNVISLLINDLSGVLPLCFLKDEVWNVALKPYLDESVVHRLINNQMVMTTCTVEQANQLIRTKIKSVFKDEKQFSDVSNWIIEKMKNVIKPGSSPRVVIELANEMIKRSVTSRTDINIVNMPEDENKKIFEKVKEIYDDEYKKIQADPESWPPNLDQLTLALQTWIDSFGEIIYSSSEMTSIKLTGTSVKQNKTFAFVIVTTKNWYVANSGAKAGIRFLSENPGSYVYYIAEKQNFKDSWNRTNESLDIFKSSGGHVIFLDENSRIQWYAVVALINRIDNGDVNLYLASGNRTATRDDIKEFLKTIKLLNFKNSPAPAAPALEIKIPASDVIANITDIVTSSPMGIINIKKISELMQQRNFQFEDSEILNLIQDRKDIFKVLKSAGGDVLVTLTAKNDT